MGYTTNDPQREGHYAVKINENSNFDTLVGDTKPELEIKCSNDDDFHVRMSVLEPEQWP